MGVLELVRELGGFKGQEVVQAEMAPWGRRDEIGHGPGESGSLVGDNTRMKELLGVEPAISLRDGVGALLSRD